MSSLQLRDYQEAGLDGLRKGFAAGHRVQMFYAPTGGGKCLAIDTPVLMANGQIKPVQNIKEGDRLVGPDGNIKNVLSITKGNERLYRITPTKGDSYVVNESHILSLRKTLGSDVITLSSGEKIPSDADIVNVNVRVLHESNKTAKHCLKGWRSEGIENFFCDDEKGYMPITAYILGAWLGDGISDAAVLCKPYCNMVKEWIDYGKSINLECRDESTEGRCSAWRLTNGRDGLSFNLFTSHLAALDLLNSKHIPEQYKSADYESRLNLIAGLLDSDGAVSKSGYDWISKSKKLADDFVFVCRSVGLSAYISECTKSIKTLGFTGTYWRVSISGDCNAIPCRDKKAPPRLQKKRHLVHGISIDPVGYGDYYGFEIDGDKLFLLGDFTVTHNTELAISMLDSAAEKGRRCAMVMDRRVLCNQTSERLDKYGIDHGVLMAGHWRFHTYKSIQICSAQTLEKRGSFPGLKLLIVDEAHTTRKSVADFIKNNDQVKVVGLSASPFTKGLGKIYSNVVSKTSTKQLVDMGMLAPLRVFIAKEIDMSGAKKIAGEWSQAEATERGIKITGDVVNEWVKKTHEIFGEPKKTIVFCAGVAHGLDLREKFKEAGYNFVSISYKDDDDTKADALKEFAKPDSSIHGLIATDILTKGFDCILEGSLIHTNHGEIPIDKLSLDDKIWDGREYVNHGGAIYRGEKNVISYCGLTATEDHRVKTESGWVSFGDCAKKQIAIITTGNGRKAIQEHENYFTGTNKKTGECEMVKRSLLSMRVRRLWNKIKHHSECINKREVFWLQKLFGFKKSSDMVSKKVSKHEGSLSKFFKQAFQELWWSWNRVQVQFSPSLCGMDSKKYGVNSSRQKHANRQDRQQWTLPSWKSAVGQQKSSELQYSTRWMGCNDAQIQDGSSRNKVCRQNIQESIFNGLYTGNDNREIPQEIRQTKGRVWDILNAGPRNSFTCNGLLVHNCADVMIGISARPFTKSFSSHVQQLGRIMRPHADKSDAIWLDHSGNFLRFQDQWDELYSEGVSELDDGAEKPKPEPTDKEKEAAKCSICGELWGPLDACQHCGHIRPRRNAVLAVPGEMQEIRIGKSKEKAASNAAELYAMCCTYAREHSTLEKQKGRAAHIYRDIVGDWPPKEFNFDRAPYIEISNPVLNQIKRRNIAFSRAVR